MTTAAIKSHPCELPQTLNGYPVIGVLPRYGRDGDFVVLVYRQGHTAHEYVVATWLPRFGDSWDCGDYINILTDAIAHMVARMRDPELRLEQPKAPGDPVPAGFKRYTCEVVVPDEIDSSDLLEQIQTLAVEAAEYAHDDDDLPDGLADEISNACSVQESR